MTIAHANTVASVPPRRLAPLPAGALRCTTRVRTIVGMFGGLLGIAASC
jgi:hypothetical protein